MIDFISNKKKALILATAIGIGSIATGCGGDKPSTTQNDINTPGVEQPANTNQQGGFIELDGKKHLRNFDEKYYVDKYSINDDIQLLLENPSLEGKFFWLDIDLLREEVAYVYALAEAYDNGTCPQEIKYEAEILYFAKKIYEDDQTGYLAFLIASMNSYYNMMALKSTTGADYTFSESDCYGTYKYFLELYLKIEEEDEIVYNLAKLIHESCCDEKHTQLEDGYSYCDWLDEFENFQREQGPTEATSLRLTK